MKKLIGAVLAVSLMSAPALAGGRLTDSKATARVKVRAPTTEQVEKKEESRGTAGLGGLGTRGTSVKPAPSKKAR
ncbi:MAG: hypothetical protein HYZ28_21475 [Myxococcales bacterium]|nr:hypothetical protein [Myxococcales bacterium]